MVLTNAANSGMLLEEFFEPSFIFQKLGEILLRAELPSHVSCGPKTRIPVVH